jgi:glycerate 2-kinase
MNILIVPDKFKGTLSAAEAAEAMAAGWRRARPRDELVLAPMSDGGDGFGPVLSTILEAEPVTTETVDAAHQPIAATWWWSPKAQTAIVETARVIGLAMLPKGQFHPFDLDTFGLGAVLRAAQERGAKVCLAGIGGSATNDGGFGLARGLGYRFWREDRTEITQWIDLELLASIESPPRLMRFEQTIIASDVRNELLGPEGASRIYGPQKGLRAKDFPRADRALGRLAAVAARDLGRDCAREPGTGAAGGLGYGLRVFLHGAFESGFDIFARLAHLDEKIAAADLILTGEGRLDQSTWMGKGPGAVAELARARGKRCFGLGGGVAALPRGMKADLFERTAGICPDLAPFEEASRRPGYWLAQLAESVARELER